MNGLRLSSSLSPLLMLLCAGCMVGPSYHRPAVAVPQQYQELAGWMRAAPAAAAPKGAWWTVFHDPLLDRLEPTVAVSNQTVRQSYENYQQALASVRVARSELYPSISANGSLTRSGGPITYGNINSSSTSPSSGTNPATGNPSSTTTTTSTTPTATTAPGGGRVINAATLEAGASWTPDLWGQVRRTIEESTATAQADEATLANATLSEQTLLAETLIELRYADADLDLQQKTVNAYRQSLNVTQSQASAGITATPPSAVITAQVSLESQQAALTGLGVARAQYAHAIAVLVGKNPEELDIPPGTTMPAVPLIPTGVPATLLQRRPDIATAERTMASQNAAVGIAVSAYYPTLSLSAAAGFAQSPVDGLLHAANYLWSLGASGAETVLDFGARRGRVQAARAAYETAVASYRGTVLTAFQDVENDLATLRILGSEAQQLDVAVRDAVRGTDIALAEFQAGTVDYTTVAVAQEAQLTDQQTALSVQENRLLAAVALIGDLGGGWSDTDLHKP